VRGEEGCPDLIRDRERANIEASNGRVLRLPINADGTLGQGTVVVDGIPVVERDHGVNDIDVGPDGALYLSIGGVDYLWDRPNEISTIDHEHLDWLGSILRVEPDSGNVTHWVAGLRNVYGLAFGPDGRMFGVDNDGPTVSGWRHEELLELMQGGQYGYPAEGTFGPFSVPRDPPIYVLSSIGDAGIAWFKDGLVIGGCRSLQWIPLIRQGGSYEVEEARFVRQLADIPGCVTSIVPTPTGLLAAAFGPPDAVYLVPSP